MSHSKAIGNLSSTFLHFRHSGNLYIVPYEYNCACLRFYFANLGFGRCTFARFIFTLGLCEAMEIPIFNYSNSKQILIIKDQ